ncbi:MAG TPA: hypothetical protein VMD59_07890 [Acidimicrobiales bacterium]|nr:hypothetical protein [Acidimicrobiales bacterium]
MTTWSEFAALRPDLATAGRELLYQHGVGLAFLATVRPDGRPRLHPMCPLVDRIEGIDRIGGIGSSGSGAEAHRAPGSGASAEPGLFAFIVPSPKQADLRRNGWYSMHSFPCPDNEDAFVLTGRAVLVEDPALRDRLAAQFVAERAAIGVPLPASDHALFGFELDSCLLTRTSGHGDHTPVHTVWRESES